MKKRKYELTFVHKLLIIVLIFAGMMFFLKPEAYSVTLSDQYLENATLPLLHAGDYEMDVSYVDSPEGNALLVYSDQAVREDNQATVEFVREELSGETGTQKICFHLNEDVYSVKIKTVFDDDGYTYMSRLHLQSVQLMNRDNFFISGLCLLAAAAIFLTGCFLPQHRYRNQAILLGMGLAASFPLFSDSLMVGDDLLFHITRIEGLCKGLAAGEFPVRINSIQTLGLGNLSATMYPQLFLYPIAFLHLLGVSTMVCYKLLLVCINIASAYLSFYSIKGITKSCKAGFVASVLYTFSLYRLNNVYYRAALGEALAMIFLPLVLWGIYEVLWGDRRRWPILMLGVTGVMQSHVLSMEICILFFIIEALVWLFSPGVGEKLHRIFAGLKAVVGSLLLNASFLVPFLFFCGEDFLVFHVQGGVPDSVAYLSQMFSFFPNATGTSMSRGVTTGEMPLTVGGILGVGVIVFLIAMLERKEKTVEGALGGRCLYYGILALILSSWIFPYETMNQNELFIKMTSPLQFAWRFLGTASLFLCVTATCGVVLFGERENRKWIYPVILTVALVSAGYFCDSVTNTMEQISDKWRLEASNIYDFLYMYNASFDFDNHGGCIVTCNGSEVAYSGYEKRGNQIKVNVEPVYKSGSAEEDYLLFPLYYYPGYEVKVNGEAVKSFSKNLRVACKIPEGEAYIEVSYKGLPAFRIADIVSLVTAMGMIGYVVISRLRKKRKGRLGDEIYQNAGLRE